MAGWVEREEKAGRTGRGEERRGEERRGEERRGEERRRRGEERRGEERRGEERRGEERRGELCGCGLLGVGIWLSVSQGSFATFSPSLPALSAANMVIGIGAIVMVTGFLGCLGAIKENKCLLLSFFIVLLIILLAEVILLILVFVYSDKSFCVFSLMENFESFSSVLPPATAHAKQMVGLRTRLRPSVFDPIVPPSTQHGEVNGGEGA
ncbi:Tetraspanin-9 [Takifugu flavidus]|uniref:Tetraspanin-9 n=1 Tax=Takifugu flavidus TaxID=433684 RepID=A0A5C6PAX4_9TELE|nr:Tetraspanin-9 [Takifugu flavidus]